MKKRILLVAMAVAVLSLGMGVPAPEAEAAPMCLVEGSICTNGQECCSQRCWRDEGGGQYCLAEEI